MGHLAVARGGLGLASQAAWRGPVPMCRSLCRGVPLAQPAVSLTRVTPDMEFLEVLTEGLDRVLLVRGSGREVVTIYS